MSSTTLRGDGTTTRQIIEAPENAIYIWVNADTSYPKQIARRHGRLDLEFRSPTWLERNSAGIFADVVVDHAVRLSVEAIDKLDHIKIRRNR